MLSFPLVSMNLNFLKIRFQAYDETYLSWNTVYLLPIFHFVFLKFFILKVTSIDSTCDHETHEVTFTNMFTNFFKRLYQEATSLDGAPATVLINLRSHTVCSGSHSIACIKSPTIQESFRMMVRPDTQ